MTGQEPVSNAGAHEVAQQAADRLALALEDVGFDVGMAFPLLRGTVTRTGMPVVDLGKVAEPIASRLTAILISVALARPAE